jgi:hypothetical protein
MHSAIVHGAFAFQGFSSKSQDFSDTGGGWIDAAVSLEPWAHKLALIQEITERWHTVPSVFAYEVSAPFGAWLRSHLNSPDSVKRAAIAELTRDFYSRAGSPLTPPQYRTVRAIA